jgi:hypothetical protein
MTPTVSWVTAWDVTYYTGHAINVDGPADPTRYESRARGVRG